MENEDAKEISRRTALKQLSFLACSVSISILGPAALSNAQDKISKEQANYQNHPMGEQRCGNCVHFVPAQSACRIVQGEISPQAWCKFWAGS